MLSIYTGVKKSSGAELFRGGLEALGPQAEAAEAQRWCRKVGEDGRQRQSDRPRQRLDALRRHFFSLGYDII